MKLGELLVNAGKLTLAQVEEALKGQAIFGGRFGTNLIEMGYLDEHDLAHFLSKKSGVPHAAPEQLMDIPPQVLRILPEQVVRKYRVVPVALNNRKLILAMTDPSDFAAIDEISFQTGYIVFPVIVPELRLVAAMEKHYNIRRELRYIKVDGGGRNRAAREAAAAQSAQPTKQQEVRSAAQAAAPVELEEDILELPLLSEFGFGEFKDSDIVLSQPLNAHAAPAPQQAQQAQPVQAPQPAQPVSPKELNLEGVLLGLTQADDRHSIAELIVSYTAQKFKKSAIFLLKNGTATGWVAQIGKEEVAGFEDVEIPLNEPSILSVVAHTKNYYLGPLPITPGNNRFLAALGGGTPLNNLFVPLMMMGRVVAILYLEGTPSQRLDDYVADLQKLLGKGSLAFEILILKNKIMSP